MRSTRYLRRCRCPGVPRPAPEAPAVKTSSASAEAEASLNFSLTEQTRAGGADVPPPSAPLPRPARELRGREGGSSAQHGRGRVFGTVGHVDWQPLDAPVVELESGDAMRRTSPPTSLPPSPAPRALPDPARAVRPAATSPGGSRFAWEHRLLPHAAEGSGPGVCQPGGRGRGGRGQNARSR